MINRIFEPPEDAALRPDAAPVGPVLPDGENPFIDALGVPRHKGLTDDEWAQFLDDVVGPAQAPDDEFEVYLNGYRDAPEVRGG